MATVERVSIGFQRRPGAAAAPEEANARKPAGRPQRRRLARPAPDEGQARINLDQVVYVQTDSAEPRVGFGQ